MGKTSRRVRIIPNTFGLDVKKRQCKCSIISAQCDKCSFLFEKELIWVFTIDTLKFYFSPNKNHMNIHPKIYTAFCNLKHIFEWIVHLKNCLDCSMVITLGTSPKSLGWRLSKRETIFVNWTLEKILFLRNIFHLNKITKILGQVIRITWKKVNHQDWVDCDRKNIGFIILLSNQLCNVWCPGFHILFFHKVSHNMNFILM